MKNSVVLNTMYWNSVHGVIVMKKYVAGKPFSSAKNSLNKSRYNQEHNDSVEPKIKQ